MVKPSLQIRYEKEVIPAMMKRFGYSSPMEVPKLKFISVNVGLNSEFMKDPKYLGTVEGVLKRITGQQPAFCKAKKSISTFKLRKGSICGLKCTLRRRRMYDFFDKFVNIVLPRVRDFRGISRNSIDSRGNISVGIREYIVFPEIRPDEVERLHPLEVVINTTAKTQEEGYEFLKSMNFPFKD